MKSRRPIVSRELQNETKRIAQIRIERTTVALLFAIDHALIDFREPKLFVQRQRRRVLLHCLRFDAEDAPLVKPLKGFA